jgi:hypothetical protein
MSSFARSIRASRSSFVNGFTRPANEGSAAIGAGREVGSLALVCAIEPAAAAVAAAAEEILKKVRLETMLSPEQKN